MSKYTNTLAADGTAQIAFVKKPRSLTDWLGTFFVTGTFGGGTLAWQWSPDGGTTKLALKDLTGTAITSTAADSFNGTMGTASKNGEEPILYATLTGSTNPSLTFGVFTNEG